MLKHSSTEKKKRASREEFDTGGFVYAGTGAAVCNALDEVLQSFLKSVEPVVSLTEMSMSSELHVASSCLNTSIFNSPAGRRHHPAVKRS
jgi:hypothetical protein